MNSIPATRVTNVVKSVHDWQHDGHQIGLFYGTGDNTVCPTGCGEEETRHHFISCKAPQATLSFRQRVDVFKGVHKRHRTASAIFTAFLNIIHHIRHQSRVPRPFRPQFGSSFGTGAHWMGPVDERTDEQKVGGGATTVLPDEPRYKESQILQSEGMDKSLHSGLP